MVRDFLLLGFDPKALASQLELEPSSLEASTYPAAARYVAASLEPLTEVKYNTLL